MRTILCTDTSKSVTLMFNADGFGGILAVANQDREYWFTIGWFKTEAGAIRSAKRKLARLGYTLNA